MPTTLATGLPQLDLEADATVTVAANDPNAVLTKVTIHLSSGAPLIGESGTPILLAVGS
jgi:hypothetical protein